MKKSIAALLALTLTATTAFSFAAVAEESADLLTLPGNRSRSMTMMLPSSRLWQTERV